MKLSSPQKRLGPIGLFACIIITQLLVILAIDMYIPALPSMQKSFDVSASYLNMTMFAYLVMSAVGMLLMGPLSDSLGRKPLLVASSVVFTATSFGAAITPGIEALVLCRMGQALAQGTVSTMATAMVKDAYEKESLKMAMTALQSLIIVGPAAAPFLGTFVLSLTDWRGIFIALGLAGIVCIALSLLISETRPTTTSDRGNFSSELKTIFGNAKTLVRDKEFVSLAGFMGIAGLPYFAFLAVVSYVLLDFFQASYVEYSVIYALACCVTIVSPFIYMGLSKRMSVRSLLALCIALSLVTLALLIVAGAESPWMFLAALAPYFVCEGVVRPLGFMVMLDQPDEMVGAASSLSNFAYNAITAFGTVFATLAWTNYIDGIAVITGASAAIMIALYFANLRNIKA